MKLDETKNYVIQEEGSIYQIGVVRSGGDMFQRLLVAVRTYYSPVFKSLNKSNEPECFEVNTERGKSLIRLTETQII